MLTWLIEDTSLFPLVDGIITENDFLDPLYHQVAAMLFAQYRETKQVVPAKIVNHFESIEDQNEISSLFNASLSEDLSVQEREKALNETIIRIKKNSLDNASRNVTDIGKLQEIIKEQASLQKLHISLNHG